MAEAAKNSLFVTQYILQSMVSHEQVTLAGILVPVYATFVL